MKHQRLLTGLAAAVCVFAVGCGPSTRGTDNDDNTDDNGPCDPGATGSCYDGDIGTEGVGPCTPGTRTCGSDGMWGACQGQVIPASELCANNIDDNCNGSVDEDIDADGDGYTTCGGDCCDSVGSVCDKPSLVNPGAYEVAGNEVDDDCDGNVDNELALCDSGLASNSAVGLDYAAAMDLCQTTTEAPGSRWGVISAEFTRTNGANSPNADQRSIRPVFGATVPRAGSSLVMISTGNAAAPGQSAPSHVNFQNSRDFGTTSALPADWLTANGGDVPNAPGCPGPAGTNGNDPVMLTLRVRVPSNAKSFQLDPNFLSSEYPEWVCSAFNDFFVVLLDSTYAGDSPNPTDKNLAIYTNAGGDVYPVGVNLAANNTGLFTQCKNGPIGCAGVATGGTISTCVGTDELVGTGMDVTNPGSNPDVAEVGYCGANNLLGGGTGFLTTSGNVVGGEIITLRIALWDTSDGIYDSVAVLDNFRWSIETSEPGTVID